MGLIGRAGPSEHLPVMRGWTRPAFSRTSAGWILPALVLAVAYFVPAKLGLRFITVSGVSAVWPASGVAVGGLLLFGLGAWPGILIGQFAVDVTNGLAPASALGIATGQSLAAVAAVSALRVWRFDRRLARVSDVAALTAAAGLGGVVSASVGTVVLSFAGFFASGGWALPWLTWWVSDAMAIVVVTPMLLVAATAIHERQAFREHRIELLLLAAASAAASRMLFGSTLPLVFLVFPFVLWGALRLGPPGAAMVNVVVAGTVVWATVAGIGSFATLPSRLGLVTLQAFIASVSVTGLVLAAVTSEWKWALDDVRDSRARLVEAGDVERRRVERNLHDGAQQRLVSVSYGLGLVQARLGADEDPRLRRGIERASEELQQALRELRELARGIHPAILSQDGLRAAVESLGEHLPVPLQATVPAARYPPLLEATAYFVVSEAVANAAKHAQANVVVVDIRERRGMLIVEVRDDGVGGATPVEGSGLVGLTDRIAAVGGRMDLESPTGGGTCLRAQLPCG